MDVKEYRAKQSAMDTTAAYIDAAARRLVEAAKQLSDWKNTTSPKAKARTDVAEWWSSLLEINELIERYWAEREDVRKAWDALPEEIRELRPPPDHWQVDPRTGWATMPTVSGEAAPVSSSQASHESAHAK